MCCSWIKEMELSAFFSFSRARASIFESQPVPLCVCSRQRARQRIACRCLCGCCCGNVGGAGLSFWCSHTRVRKRDIMAAEIERRCVFCRIAAKDESAEVVYEDSDYICFRDRSPAATHHYLLIPRTHIRSARTLSGRTGPK